MLGFISKYLRPPVRLVMFDPATKSLKRYEGRRCTDEVQVIEDADAEGMRALIEDFRVNPEAYHSMPVDLECA